MPTRLSLTVPLLLALVLTACGGEAPAPPPEEMEPVTVETATATATAAAQAGRYSGTIQGTRRVPLATKMMGTVTQLAVEEGDRVRKGETLARLRWIRTGTQQGRRVEVLSGLRPGETYVVDATPRIADGQPVRTE